MLQDTTEVKKPEVAEEDETQQKREEKEVLRRKGAPLSFCLVLGREYNRNITNTRDPTA